MPKTDPQPPPTLEEIQHAGLTLLAKATDDQVAYLEHYVTQHERCPSCRGAGFVGAEGLYIPGRPDNTIDCTDPFHTT